MNRRKFLANIGTALVLLPGCWNYDWTRVGIVQPGRPPYEADCCRAYAAGVNAWRAANPEADTTKDATVYQRLERRARMTTQVSATRTGRWLVYKTERDATQHPQSFNAEVGS
jgi:hypothetical protein